MVIIDFFLGVFGFVYGSDIKFGGRVGLLYIVMLCIGLVYVVVVVSFRVVEVMYCFSFWKNFGFIL